MTHSRVAGPPARPLKDIGVVPPPGDYLARIWQRRDFIWAVPIGQLRAQTQSTLLGAGWHLLNPLLTAALYYFVFGVLFRGGGRVENYPAFLVIGVFTFLYTNRAVTAGARSVTSNLGLLTTINFPRLSLPIAATVAETLSHTWALGALFIMVPILGGPPRASWALIVPIVLLQAVFNLGAAFVVARLSFQFRDIDSLLPHALRFWMYLSGLFFSIDFVIDAVGADDHPIVAVFRANPAYIYMTLMRDALMGRQEAQPWMWGAAGAWALIALVGGFLYFRAREVEYGRG